MIFRWQLQETQSLAWLQDENRCFFAVDLGHILHSQKSGDLEQFDPKRCPACNDEAGWLPADFSFCHLCGTELTEYCSDAPKDESHWPCLVLSEKGLPIGSKSQRSLPPGSDFTFALLRRRNRLIALEGDSGKIWVWSRPSGKWSQLLTPPTGLHGIPPGRFGVLTADAVLVYPTCKGAVWIDTSASGPTQAEVTDWLPAGAPAKLGRHVVMPAFSGDKCFCIACRHLNKDGGWKLSPVKAMSKDSLDSREQTPSYFKDDSWMGRPLVSDGEVHWSSSEGILHCDQYLAATLHKWPHNFKPIIGPPVMETRDHRVWQIGYAPNKRGEMCWAFSRLSAISAPECRRVDGAFFTAGRLCFRFGERYLDAPWNDSSTQITSHRISDNSFLLPICMIGDEGALLLQINDQNIMPALLEGNVNKIRGELYLSRSPGVLESLEVTIQFDGRRWPQAFVFNNDLYVYDAVGRMLYSWTTQV